MQVSTSAFYDRSSRAMTLLSAQADRLQTQISTKVRLQAPSDDAAAYARLRGLKQDGADAAAASGNLDTAATLLQQADTTLTSITAQLQRASELAIRARNGTENAAARQAIAAELEQIGDQLVALGNGTDGRGQPLFGGADGGPGVVRQPDGSFAYAAVAPSAIPVGNGQAVQANESARRVFTGGGVDALATIATLAAALRSAGGGGGDVDAAIGTAIGDLATASTQVDTVQASLGARAARVDIDQAAARQADIDREAARSSIEDTDMPAAITELQKTMTVLSATQASFAKLQSLSLFDYLR